MITIIKASAKVNDQKHGTNAKITHSSSSIIHMTFGSTAPSVTDIAFSEVTLRRLTSAIETGGIFLSPLRCRLSSVSRTAERRSRIHSVSDLVLIKGDLFDSHDQSVNSAVVGASIPASRALGIPRHQCRLQLRGWIHLKRSAEAFVVVQKLKVLPFLPGVLLCRTVSEFFHQCISRCRASPLCESLSA
ncbi:hypothetical protein KC368_g8 [Hortaea werneckii]|nr:hypothetical protein KC368_g8 [Hortaea werneckii]